MKLTPKPIETKKQDKKVKKTKDAMVQTEEQTRKRPASDTSMMISDHNKRHREDSIAPIDANITTRMDEEVFGEDDDEQEEGALTEDDLIRLIPPRYKEQALKLIPIFMLDYDHTIPSGQEHIIELINLYLFRHTKSMPQGWMYPKVLLRLREIKELGIVPPERSNLLVTAIIERYRKSRSIETRSGHSLDGRGLTSIF